MNRDIIGQVFPDALKKIDAGLCPTCGTPVGEFRDEASVREHQISGMCQACQDRVFGR